jgi:hypothetical protein
MSSANPRRQSISSDEGDGNRFGRVHPTILGRDGNGVGDIERLRQIVRSMEEEAKHKKDAEEIDAIAGTPDSASMCSGYCPPPSMAGSQKSRHSQHSKHSSHRSRHDEFKQPSVVSERRPSMAPVRQMVESSPVMAVVPAPVYHADRYHGIGRVRTKGHEAVALQGNSANVEKREIHKRNGDVEKRVVFQMTGDTRVSLNFGEWQAEISIAPRG